MPESNLNCVVLFSLQHFISDRKIDEELANTDRFVGDCESLVKVKCTLMSLFYFVTILMPLKVANEDGMCRPFRFSIAE